MTAVDISALRLAAAAGEAACRAIADVARPGISLRDLEIAARDALAKTDGVRALRVDIHGSEEMRVLGAGDLVAAELAVACRDAEARQSLAVAIGDVHPDLARCAAAARAAYEAGLAALRPGDSSDEVLSAMRSAVGGEVRLLPHLESLAASSFTLEPEVCLGRRCVRIGGTVLFRERGAEELNPFPSRLRHVRIVRSVSANA